MSEWCSESEVRREALSMKTCHFRRRNEPWRKMKLNRQESLPAVGKGQSPHSSLVPIGSMRRRYGFSKEH